MPILNTTQTPISQILTGSQTEIITNKNSFNYLNRIFKHLPGTASIKLERIKYALSEKLQLKAWIKQDLSLKSEQRDNSKFPQTSSGRTISLTNQSALLKGLIGAGSLTAAGFAAYVFAQNSTADAPDSSSSGTLQSEDLQENLEPKNDAQAQEDLELALFNGETVSTFSVTDYNMSEKTNNFLSEEMSQNSTSLIDNPGLLTGGVLLAVTLIGLGTLAIKKFCCIPKVITKGTNSDEGKPITPITDMKKQVLTALDGSEDLKVKDTSEGTSFSLSPSAIIQYTSALMNAIATPKKPNGADLITINKMKKEFLAKAAFSSHTEIRSGLLTETEKVPPAFDKVYPNLQGSYLCPISFDLQVANFLSNQKNLPNLSLAAPLLKVLYDMDPSQFISRLIQLNQKPPLKREGCLGELWINHLSPEEQLLASLLCIPKNLPITDLNKKTFPKNTQQVVCYNFKGAYLEDLENLNNPHCFTKDVKHENAFYYDESWLKFLDIKQFKCLEVVSVKSPESASALKRKSKTTFNEKSYEKVMFSLLTPFLLDANKKATEASLKAYVQLEPIAIPPDSRFAKQMLKIQFECYLKIIAENNLENISYLDFRKFSNINFISLSIGALNKHFANRSINIIYKNTDGNDVYKRYPNIGSPPKDTSRKLLAIQSYGYGPDNSETPNDNATEKKEPGHPKTLVEIERPDYTRRNLQLTLEDYS